MWHVDFRKTRIRQYHFYFDTDKMASTTQENVLFTTFQKSWVKYDGNKAYAYVAAVFLDGK